MRKKNFFPRLIAIVSDFDVNELLKNLQTIPKKVLKIRVKFFKILTLLQITRSPKVRKNKKISSVNSNCL